MLLSTTETILPNRAAAVSRQRPAGDVTELLDAWRNGQVQALDELVPLIYGELRRLAQSHMDRERDGHTLQATAVVHEAYLKLIGKERPHWQSRAHFFAVASLLMRRILLDHARGRVTAKRKAGPWPLELLERPHDEPEVLIALDDALRRFARFEPRAARVVELRYFGGLNLDDTAQVLDVGPATVVRDWRRARAWLLRELS